MTLQSDTTWWSLGLSNCLLPAGKLFLGQWGCSVCSNCVGYIGIFSPVIHVTSHGEHTPLLWAWGYTKPELFQWSHMSEASSCLKEVIKENLFNLYSQYFKPIRSKTWVKAGLDLRLILYILGKHFLCLPNQAGFTLSCIVLAFRYTCPFVEKFSIDIETYYKTDPGDHVNVFNLSPAEKRQTILGE